MSSLVKRSITSVSWNMVLSFVQILVGFVRSVLLMDLLPAETFGVYAFANSVVMLTAVIPNFGMAGAFLYRCDQTKDEDQTAAVHLTIKVFFTMAWMVLLSIGAVVFSKGQNQLAFLVLIITQGGVMLCQTPHLIFERRIAHRRLALLQSINILVSAIMAVFLAWNGIGLWALLSTDIVTLVLSVFFLYIWRPIWHPHLTWSSPGMLYFLRYGSRNLVAKVLLRALDRVDDIWTGVYLGDVSVGYYSRAYALATYPRMVLAQSINSVAGGTYAELAKKRKSLSQAFFRTNAFLVRSGFYLAGLLVLIAPELLRILWGGKWLPILNTFRLMVIFTLFDPIKITIANLFLAVGKPEVIIRARAVQLLVMLIGLFGLGFRGIEGVALAVDIMLIVGIVILLHQARKYVDFSVKALLLVPGISLALGILIARSLTVLARAQAPLRIGFLKTVAFSMVYVLILLLIERRQLQKMFRFFLKWL